MIVDNQRRTSQIVARMFERTSSRPTKSLS